MNQTQLTPPLSAPNALVVFFNLPNKTPTLPLFFPPTFFCFFHFRTLFHLTLWLPTYFRQLPRPKPPLKNTMFPTKKKPLGKITSNSQKQSTITPPWRMNICMWHCLFLGTTFLPQFTFPFRVLNFSTIYSQSSLRENTCLLKNYVPSLGKWSWSLIPMALHISPHDLYFKIFMVFKV